MGYYDEIPNNQVTPSASSDDKISDRASVLRELSPDKKIKHFMKELEGKVYDPEKRKYVTFEGAKPLMNQRGRNIFLHHATSVLNSIVTTSNFRKDIKTIHALVKLQVSDATKMFFINWRKYGMEEKAVARIVVTKLQVLAMSAYYKAIGAGDRKAGTSNIHESYNSVFRDGTENPNPRSKQRGFFSRVMNPRGN